MGARLAAVSWGGGAYPVPVPRIASRAPASDGRIGASDCERIGDGLLAQPVNALSSAAYVVAAGVVVARLWGSVAERRPEVAAYAGVLALVGIGSVLYHGPQLAGAKLLHDWPIPVLLAIVAGTPLVRRRRGLAALPGWSRRRGAALGGLLAAAGLAYSGGRTGAPTCDPDSPWQLHGAWHVLTASAFVVVADILYRPDGGR